MSKETFSRKINSLMHAKFNALESYNISYFFKKDEDFELILCLAYMTLSKEKLIKKEIKNTDRLARLTQMIDTTEIDKVFKKGFAEEMPKIYFAKEMDNLWILDNIRDSIMHGAFEIDEENKCFIINNVEHDRDFKAEIPFSWFIAYAKNDMLSKKVVDKYTINHFYYNNGKKYKKEFDTKKEVINNILYKVNISGNKFNINDIEKRIVELFNIYSSDTISDDLIEKYRERINSEPIIYNEKYLVSFYIAQEKVKEKIEKEFEGINVEIQINSRKHKLCNKAEKKLLREYQNYELLFIELERLVAPKGNQLLKCISNIIENIDCISNIELNNIYNAPAYNIDLLNKYVFNESKDFFKKRDTIILSRDILNTLKEICLILHGLATIVINHENLYNNHFGNINPKDCKIFGITKNNYLELSQKRKKIIMELLEIDILLFDKNQQLINCKEKEKKIKIQLKIEELENKKKLFEKKLYILEDEINSKIYIKKNEINVRQKENSMNNINIFFNHFEQAKNSNDKKQIKKTLGKLFERDIEEDAKYTYFYCNNINEVLTIIRNCFSHIGRISFSKNNYNDTVINFNDYDNNGIKSGEVKCRYIDLVNLLNAPYLTDEYEISDVKAK